MASDPSARFAYELATTPPMKGVASVKAASDLYASDRRDDESRDDGADLPSDRRPAKEG